MITSHHRRFSLVVAVTAATGLLVSCASDPATRPATTSTATSSPSESTAPVTTGVVDTTVATTDTTETVAPDNDAAIAATRALYADVGPDTPGCSVAIARDGTVIFTEAYGAASFNPTVPLTPEMSFDIGSTSKQFTATGVQLLVDRGLVDWNAPVSTYFPEFPAWAGTITVLQLAHHTSGVPDYIGTLLDSGVAFEARVTNDELIKTIASYEALEFEPGSSWRYSNSNYVLLGALIERIASQSLATFMETEIFPKAAMTAEWDDGNPIPGQAASYARSADSEPWNELKWQWPQLGDGGVIATAAQVATWGSQYFAPTVGTAAINSQRVEGAVPMVLDGKTLGNYGLGIMTNDVDGLGQVFEHSGGWEAYATAFSVSPDNKLVAASTCLSGTGPTVTNQTLGVDLLKAWK
jgi:CubicO group peptidase (beta-lactamase class C family)